MGIVVDMRPCIFIVTVALAACGGSGSNPSADGGNASSDGGDGDGGSSPDAMIDCNAAITCPNPSMDGYTFCGRIVDVESDQLIADPSAVGLSIYDAQDFTDDPFAATALAANIEIDSCGRFRATDVAQAPTGNAILAIDDAGDEYIMTASVLQVAAGDRVPDVMLRSVRTATNEAWSAQGGLPPGTTFASLGTWIAIFTYRDQPVQGVELMRGINTVPQDSFYFGDQDTGRTTVTTAVEETGANGTGLMLDSPVQTHSGTGGEEANCAWPEVLAFGLEDVFFVSELPLLLESTDEACP